MFDRKLKDEFWTTFGKYMSLTQSATGEKQHWLNYKTGVKHVQFRMEADEKHAMIAVELSNPDQHSRQQLYNQLLADLEMLTQYTNEEWIWQDAIIGDGGRMMARIYREIKDVNIYLKSDWPTVISFLKSGITGLDSFWTEQKDFYEMITG